MFSPDDIQMLLRTFVYGLAGAAPWLLGAGAVIIGLTRGEARRALLSFIRAARRRSDPPPLSAAEVAALYDRLQDLEDRVFFAERALLKQIAAAPPPSTPPERIVVPPELLRTPV